MKFSALKIFFLFGVTFGIQNSLRALDANLLKEVKLDKDSEYEISGTPERSYTLDAIEGKIEASKELAAGRFLIKLNKNGNAVWASSMGRYLEMSNRFGKLEFRVREILAQPVIEIFKYEGKYRYTLYSRGPVSRIYYGIALIRKI